MVEEIKTIECWPEWEIVKKIGQGSFGAVYEIKKTEGNLDTRAAVKIINIPQDSSELDTCRSEGMTMEETRTTLYDIVTEFENEIQLMQKFKGTQNIVSVEDYKIIEKTDTVGWTIYIRMELLIPFFTHTAEKNLSEDDVIKLGIDICKALELCEMAKVIHRDIKPQNIFINTFGDYKLGDFGVAKTVESTTGSLSQKGTINYMAPEVYAGKKYDKTADIYSLGLVLYTLMNNGRMPFVDPDKQLVTFADREEALKKRMEGGDLPAPKFASEGFANIILRAICHDPAGRFSCAEDFRKALTSLSNGTYEIVDLDKTVSLRKPEVLQSVSPVIRPATQKDSSKKRSIYLFAAGCAVLAVIVIGVIIALGTGKKNTVETGDNKNREVSEIDSSEKELPIIVDSVANSSAIMDSESFQGDIPSLLKEKIEEAKAYASNSDYENALKITHKLIVSYPNDEELIEMDKSYGYSYEKTVINQADEMVLNNDYAGAFLKVDEALTLLGENENLAKKRANLEASYVSSVNNSLDAYLHENEYDEAIGLLERAIAVLPGDNRFSESIESVMTKKNNYEYSIERNDIIEEADRIMQKEGYQKAIDYLNNKEEYKNDATVIEKIEYYNSFAPVTLTSIIKEDGYFDKSFKEDYINCYWYKADDFLGYLDNYNNKYGSFYGIDQGYASVLIKDYGFTEFKGVVALPKGIIPDDNRKSAQLTVSLDGKVIKEFDAVTNASKPQEFLIDVSGAEVITFSVKVTGGNIWNNWGFYSGIFDGQFVKNTIKE